MGSLYPSETLILISESSLVTISTSAVITCIRVTSHTHPSTTLSSMQQLQTAETVGRAGRARYAGTLNQDGGLLFVQHSI